MRWRAKILLLLLFLGVLAFHTSVAVLLCEGALHLPHRHLPGQLRKLVENGAREFDSTMQDVQISSFDGAKLAAWFFTPREGNG